MEIKEIQKFVQSLFFASAAAAAARFDLVNRLRIFGKERVVSFLVCCTLDQPPNEGSGRFRQLPGRFWEEFPPSAPPNPRSK